MGTEATEKEMTAEQMWNEEVALREGSTADAADTTTKTTEAATTAAEASTTTAATTDTGATGTDTHTATPDATQDDDSKKADPLAELAARFDKIEQRTRNVEGHIGGIKGSQQKILDMMEAAKATTSATAPTQQQMQQAAASSEKWKKLREDFPEWGEATEELLNERLAGVQTNTFDAAAFRKEMEEKLDAQSEANRQFAVDAALNGVLPNWKQEVKTPAFAEWMKGQPDDVKALAASPEVHDAARMLHLFNVARNTPDPAKQIEEDRKSKLTAAATTVKGVKAPKEKTEDEMSPEELWNYEAKKRDKARQEAI